MSLAKVTTSKARKQYSCEACDEPILKGQRYMWYFVGFRSRFKHTRHESHGTPPRSALESSKLAEVYSALESAEDTIRALEVPTDGDEDALESFRDDLETALAETAEAIREVAEEYREADEAMGGTGQTQSAETADQLDDIASQLESAVVDGDDSESMIASTIEHLDGAEI